MADKADTLTTIRKRAERYAAEETPVGDYKAERLNHFAEMLERDTLTAREAVYATNVVIREKVTVASR